jgi:hypothetical protein
MTAKNLETAVVRGGASATNKWLYHRVRFAVGDPAAMIDLPKRNGRAESIFIVRDIEMERARRHARTRGPRAWRRRRSSRRRGVSPATARSRPPRPRPNACAGRA